MAVGGVISSASGYASDMAQADASRKNAEFYQKQAQYNEMATQRETSIFEHSTEDLLARQSSAYSRAGIDLSGSPLLLLTQTQARASEQLSAIKEKGRQATEIALLRAQDAQNQADDIEDGAFWKAAGGILGTTGRVMATAQPKGGATKTGASDWSSTGSGTYVNRGNVPQTSWSVGKGDY